MSWSNCVPPPETPDISRTHEVIPARWDTFLCDSYDSLCHMHLNHLEPFQITNQAVNGLHLWLFSNFQAPHPAIVAPHIFIQADCEYSKPFAIVITVTPAFFRRHTASSSDSFHVVTRNSGSLTRLSAASANKPKGKRFFSKFNFFTCGIFGRARRIWIKSPSVRPLSARYKVESWLSDWARLWKSRRAPCWSPFLRGQKEAIIASQICFQGH